MLQKLQCLGMQAFVTDSTTWIEEDHLAALAGSPVAWVIVSGPVLGQKPFEEVSYMLRSVVPTTSDMHKLHLREPDSVLLIPLEGIDLGQVRRHLVPVAAEQVTYLDDVARTAVMAANLEHGTILADAVR